MASVRAMDRTPRRPARTPQTSAVRHGPATRVTTSVTPIAAVSSQDCSVAIIVPDVLASIPEQIGSVVVPLASVDGDSRSAV